MISRSAILAPVMSTTSTARRNEIDNEITPFLFRFHSIFTYVLHISITSSSTIKHPKIAANVDKRLVFLPLSSCVSTEPTLNIGTAKPPRHSVPQVIIQRDPSCISVLGFGVRAGLGAEAVKMLMCADAESRVKNCFLRCGRKSEF